MFMCCSRAAQTSSLQLKLDNISLNTSVMFEREYFRAPNRFSLTFKGAPRRIVKGHLMRKEERPKAMAMEFSATEKSSQ